MDPYESIVLSLQRATHRIQREADQTSRKLGLSPVELNVLANLAIRARPSASDLAAASGLRPSTLTGVLDRLEQRFLIVRRPSTRDRRAIEVALTSEGSRKARAAARFVQVVDERVRAALTPAAVRGFHHVIEAVADLSTASKEKRRGS
jgi:DNA-binding MarR family transcriptional regulator